MRDFVAALFSDSEEEEEQKMQGPKKIDPKPLDDNYWYDPWRNTRTDLSIPAKVDTPGNSFYYKQNGMSYRDKLLGALSKPIKQQPL